MPDFRARKPLPRITRGTRGVVSAAEWRCRSPAPGRTGASTTFRVPMRKRPHTRGRAGFGQPARGAPERLPEHGKNMGILDDRFRQRGRARVRGGTAARRSAAALNGGVGGGQGRARRSVRDGAVRGRQVSRRGAAGVLGGASRRATAGRWTAEALAAHPGARPLRRGAGGLVEPSDRAQDEDGGS